MRSERLTPHSSLLTPHSSLLTPHSSLLTPHSPLLTPHSSLPLGQGPVPVAGQSAPGLLGARRPNDRQGVDLVAISQAKNQTFVGGRGVTAAANGKTRLSAPAGLQDHPGAHGIAVSRALSSTPSQWRLTPAVFFRTTVGSFMWFRTISTRPSLFRSPKATPRPR